MSTIKIKRTSEWVNRARKIGIYIDGEKIDTISNGQEKSFEISPGEHELYCKVDWTRSPKINFKIEKGETGTFKLGSFPFAQQLMVIALIIGIIHFTLDFTLGIPYVSLLLIPIFLYLLYFFTLGKDEYLSLQVVEEE